MWRPRVFVALAGLLLVSAVGAQNLGTKADLVGKSPTSAGPIVQPMDMVQMLVALGVVVFLLKWVLPKVIGRLGRRFTTQAGGTIRVVESASFGAGQLQIVDVRDKTLLLSVTATGVTFLTDLTPSTTTTAPVPEAFFDVLDRAATEYEADSPQTGESPESVEAAVALIAQAQQRLQAPTQDDTPLDRLNRLLR